MQQHPEAVHSRTQFQIDRIAFFSDAVIAIALTLMVLEIKIPELGKNITVQQIINIYGIKLFFHTIALFVGFSTIGNLWTQHHELFEHIIRYNDRLIKMNLYFLLTVMLLPISISFLFTENEPAGLKFLFYFSNLFFCNLFYSLMLLVIFSKKNNFSSLKDRKKIKVLKNRSLTISVGFLIVNILLILQVTWWYYIFFVFPIFRLVRLVREKMTKKANPAHPDNSESI